MCECDWNDDFVVEKKQQRTEVSHHLHKSEHSVNESPFPQLLCR